MLKDIQVAAFEGGELRMFASGENGREAVLALPLNRLIIKMVRVGSGEDIVEVATPILKAMSPFPDEPLTISCELVSESEEGKVVIAAALPESAADDIADKLDEAKLNVTRVDSLAIGQLRGLWGVIGAKEGGVRKLILIKSVDCISMIVLDGDRPSAIRAVANEAELKREIMLVLLEAEDFGGARELDEIIYVTSGDEPAPELNLGAPIRNVKIGSDAALVGVAERSDDPNALNALPDSWAQVLEDTRFKAKLIKYLAVAGGVWVLIMATLLGVPIVYDYMTKHQKSLTKQHDRAYLEVRDMKDKVELVNKYSNHAHGVLEIMKAISDRLPQGITLQNWSFKRDDGVRFSGEADSEQLVYSFKDAMAEMVERDEADEEDEGVRVFQKVDLRGLSSSKDGKWRFNLDLIYKVEEE